jgi:hypothetical protein
VVNGENMNNYKKIMSRIDDIIAKEQKDVPVSPTGLLGRAKMKSKQNDSNDVQHQVARYVALIRKQRELLK